MKNKMTVVVMLIMLFISSTVIKLSIKPANANGASIKNVVLGGAVASLVKARGTSEQYYWGSGCWAAVLGQKFEIYIDPTVPPFDVLGSFKIDDISSISYHTNKPGSQNEVDFYVVIYTKPDGVNDHGWYGYRLIGEPYYSRNLNAPSNQWNKWSTDIGTNQLTFFDPDTIGFYGFYGQPTLQDIQAGPINWHDYYSGCPVTNIDYGVETVKYISFQTGTGWMNTFQGYIDAITIALNNGTTVNIDLEGFASQIWVNDDWAGLPPGYEVEPGKFMGYNAFAKIQDAINAVTSEGTIIVYEGTYHENIVINKPLNLVSASLPIIEGGAAGDCISVSANNVVINGFEIRNGYNGIIGETDGSTFSNNIIHDNLNIPGYAGVGILLWGDNDNNLITGNEIYNNDRQGIFLGYSDDSKISSANTISYNKIYNNGLYRYANGPDASAYGVQLWCADSNIIQHNEIYGHDDWFPYGGTFDFAQGIYLCDSNNNLVTNNNLHNNNYAVGLWHPSRPVVTNYIHYNDIWSNTGYGIRTFDGTPVVDARFNWWGHANGPIHPSNVGGSGDRISDNIDYSPWLGATFATSPRTYHVNPTGAPGAIQEAIDEASSGDTIIVHEGTYLEALTINKGLTVKGASTPVIKGGQMRSTNYGNRQATIFVENARDVVLQNLDIEGQGLGVPGGTKSYAILYENSSGIVEHCSVSPNTIGDMYSVAIAAWDNSDMAVKECLIQNFGRIGVYSNNATMSIEGNTIIGQVYSQDNLVNYGIEIEDYSGPSIANITANVIYNCNNTSPNPSWSSAAIIVDTWREWADYYQLSLLPSKVSITYNEIYDNYESIEIVANEFSYAHYNNFHDNVWGVQSAPENWTTNPTYYVFDACFNWWGDPTGPYHPTSWEYMGEPYGPHYGSGDYVSDYVLYYPWLSEQNGPPVMPPQASFTFTPYEPKTGEAVTFDASGSTAEGGTIIEYKWNFGDGNITATTDPEVTHIYENVGTYIVNLTITDSEGLVGSISKPITVVPAITIFHDVAVINLTTSTDYIYQGWVICINVTAANLGQVSENLTVTLYYDSNVITVQTIQCLEPNTTIILHFNWNTTGVPYCHNYTISAFAAPVPYETELANNECIDGSVKIAILGDINGDGAVNILDCIAASTAFGSSLLDPRWNNLCDLNNDGRINILDLILMANNFGKHC